MLLVTFFGLSVAMASNVDQNSQNMSLLQANVSSASIFQEKNAKESVVDDTKNVNILSDNALLPATGPVVSEGIDNGESYSDQVSVYVVRKGDSISQIADMFDVTANTIRWANNMKSGDVPKEGDVLLILPVSGVEHIVKKGETLAGIAKKYGADVNDIIQYNDIVNDSNLIVGNTIIVPDGEIANPASKPITKSGNSKPVVVKNPTKNTSGYFINPVPGYSRISQRKIHANNGVDLAAPSGTPIYAAAAGKVLIARYGWNGGYGNMVLISHANGTQTLYAHQKSLVARSGEMVSQGQLIGYVGTTGHSTGNHLHYEVHGGTNNAKFLP